MSVDGAAPVRAKIKEIVPDYSFPAGNSSQTVGETLTEGNFKAVAGNH
jgi:hypothetical protein